jgi:toxin YoeB
LVRKIIFHKQAFDDFLFWSKNDLKVVKKIIELINDIQKHPFEGLGKPEALKHGFKGAWSRRITDEHRLIYLITDTDIGIIACRFHYTS